MHPGQKLIMDTVNSAINQQAELERKAALYDELLACLKSLLHAKQHGNGLQAWWDLEERAEALIAKAEDK